MKEDKKIILYVVLTFIMPPVGIALLLINSLNGKKAQQNTGDNTLVQNDSSKEKDDLKQVQGAKEEKTNLETKNVVNYNSHGITPRELALKENKKILCIVIIITIVLAILSIVFEFIGGEVLQGISIACLVGFLLSVCIIFCVLEDKKRIKRSYCPTCGKKYDYEKDISWETSNITVNDNGAKDADLEFECKCSNCNKTINFKKRFRIAEFQKSNYVEKNINVLVKKYFK